MLELEEFIRLYVDADKDTRAFVEDFLKQGQQSTENQHLPVDKPYIVA